MPPKTTRRTRTTVKIVVGAHVAVSLTEAAVAHLVGQFNVDEALEYLRAECDAPDDATDDVIQSCEDALRKVLRAATWRQS